MNLKILPTIILLLLFVNLSFAQDTKWNETKNWKLYKLNNRAAFNYSADTLRHFKSLALSDSVMQGFLSSVSVWPLEKKSVWMGLLVATYETGDNKLCKVNISNYGGFFFDENSKSYYQLPESLRNDWIKYLNGELDKLFAE